MGYDLIFWCYKDEGTPRSQADHAAAYQALCREEPVAELLDLPGEEIETELWDALQGGWSKEGRAWVRPGAVIEVSISASWVRFDLRGDWADEDANLLIDTMNGFDCPLYDPQASERFVL